MGQRNPNHQLIDGTKSHDFYRVSTIIIYPLVICYIAIENGPVEIVDFPIKHGGSFHSYVSLPEANYGLITIKSPFSYGFPMGKSTISWGFSKPTVTKISGNRTTWWDLICVRHDGQ